MKNWFQNINIRLRACYFFRSPGKLHTIWILLFLQQWKYFKNLLFHLIKIITFLIVSPFAQWNCNSDSHLCQIDSSVITSLHIRRYIYIIFTIPKTLAQFEMNPFSQNPYLHYNHHFQRLYDIHETWNR